ncbi:NAD(+) diphosphatase [Aliidiomarina minuta]|uniref:NAD(+) diphosphatase n=1 Tax=Aliidiomarina minuta TaxID=880057 RepID=A0A432W3Z2_9GAMM|nr:NAD(+) diphosphatase [Aliidiomarina minuta]RUO24067.1 NAD(+) diphosphatase [Aliidiomarina minuta]
MIYPRPETSLKNESIWLLVHSKNVMQADEGEILPCASGAQMASFCDASEYIAQIGEYEGKKVYLLVMPDSPELPGYSFQPLRTLLAKLDSQLFALAGRACQIAHFIKTHNFCSHCGEPLQEVLDELAVYCTVCDYRTYPRISPCIIVAVHRPGEILLARGSRHPEGLYSVLAGFVESGESLEQTVHREVFEEAGIDIKNVTYVTSQPWPFPHSLMAGFIAEHAAGEIKLDGIELLEGGWFSLRNLPQTPPSGTIAATLIEEVIKAQRI